MPEFENASAWLYFEERGDGFPMLAFAPGGMNSAVRMWKNATINPLTDYANDFRVIAMDQRNADRSYGPVETDDPWGMYARDHLALMDHLGVDAFHVFGCCIGGSFALKLIELAPTRVVSAVLQQPVGITEGNAPLYEEMWRSWAGGLPARDQNLDRDAIERFGIEMWTGDFVLSVSRDFVRSCTTPLMVLPGTESYHPTATGREIGELAAEAVVVEPWNDSELHIAEATTTVRGFLKTHTPK